MATRQRGPNLFIDHMVKKPKLKDITQRPVKSQPVPIATMRGSVTTLPTHLLDISFDLKLPIDDTYEKILRTKLFSAI